MKRLKDTIEKQVSQTGRSAGELKKQALRTADRFIDRLLDQRISLGVTGFSGSGKSTLITSLIHQLQHYQKATLPAFSPVLQGRLLGVQIHPLDDLPLFPFEEGRERLCQTPPKWPHSTSSLSGCLLEIRFRPRSKWRFVPNRPYEHLLVEIRDYPGEWLLDLPLLSMSYAQWCQECLRIFSLPPRSDFIGPLKETLGNIDPLAPIDPPMLATLHSEYVEFLKQCKEAPHELSLIQPGRFLLPDNAKALPFIPLLQTSQYSEETLKKANENSWFHECNKHYQHYIEQCVKPFYQDHFSKIDRQLILVDILKALHQGKPYFEELQVGLSRVLDSFKYGHNSLLSRLFNPKIERVLFAATKIDQVLPDQHEAVRALISHVIQDAYRKATYELTDIHCEAIAAVRSTSITEYQGKHYLQGAVQKIGTPDISNGLMSHPQIPSGIPNEQDWQSFETWKLKTLLPPSQLNLQHGEALPHIRLDAIIRDLIGDKC